MVSRKQIEFKDPDLNTSRDYSKILRFLIIVCFICFLGIVFYNVYTSPVDNIQPNAGIKFTYLDKTLYLNYNNDNPDSKVLVTVYGVDDGRFVGYGNFEIYSEEHVGDFTTSFELEQTRVNTFLVSIYELVGDRKVTTWYGVKRDVLDIGTIYKM